MSDKPNHHTDTTTSQLETQSGLLRSEPPQSGPLQSATPQAGRKQSGPLDLFPIGLGCTGMTPHSSSDSPRRQELIQVLRTAAELGVEFFDTSEIQGPYTGEELLGDAFARAHTPSAASAGSSVQAPTIATKFGWNIAHVQPTGELNSRPETIRRVAQESARRLGVERLDLFMQHRVDPDVPIEEVAGTVGELVDEGLVAHFGLCEASATTIARAHREFPVAAVESEYSLWSRGVEESVLPTCAELGIGFIAYSPLAKGMLSAQLTEPNADSNSPRLHPDNFAQNQRNAARVAEIAHRYDATAAQIALAWLLDRGAQHPGGMLVLPGSINPARIQENVAAASVTLADDDRAALDNLLDTHPLAGERYVDKHLRFIDRD